MAIITVVLTDSTPEATRWAMPATEQALRSPVPLGLIRFQATAEIATLVGGNQTSVAFSCAMPAGFAYLVRGVMWRFQSDDLDLSFDPQGRGWYNRVGLTNFDFNISSPGVIDLGAANATRIWTPDQGTPKVLLKGGDGFNARVQDMDVAADGATAGDVVQVAEFYVFTLDQIDKWEVNTPIPVINHSAF